MHSGNGNVLIWGPFCPYASGQSISHLYQSQDAIWCCNFRLHTTIFSKKRAVNAFLYTLCFLIPEVQSQKYISMPLPSEMVPQGAPISPATELWALGKGICRNIKELQNWQHYWQMLGEKLNRERPEWARETGMHSELHHNFSNFIPFGL